jgi:hypothetical protein
LLCLDAATVNVDELLLRAAAEAARQELLAVQARLGSLLRQVRVCACVHVCRCPSVCLCVSMRVRVCVCV